MSADLQTERASKKSFYAITFSMILVIVIVGVIATKIVRDNARKAEAREQISMLKKALDKDDPISKRAAAAHKKYLIALDRATVAGQKRHDDALSSDQSSEKYKHYVLIEQSGVQDSTKFVGKEIDELDEEISNFGEVLGYDFVRKNHDDVSAYRESRLAALGTWQRGINEIVDESVAGRELVPASVIRQTYDSVGEKMDRANKLEETVIQNSSDLYALITKKLLAAGAVAGR